MIVEDVLHLKECFWSGETMPMFGAGAGEVAKSERKVHFRVIACLYYNIFMMEKSRAYLNYSLLKCFKLDSQSGNINMLIRDFPPEECLILGLLYSIMLGMWSPSTVSYEDALVFFRLIDLTSSR